MGENSNIQWTPQPLLSVARWLKWHDGRMGHERIKEGDEGRTGRGGRRLEVQAHHGGRGAEVSARMTTWVVTFDGSTDPGTVVLTDGACVTRATFATDDEAKLHYGLLAELVDEVESLRRRADAATTAVRRALAEVARWEDGS